MNTVHNHITNADYKPKGKHNLDARARAALKRLSLDTEIIIKPADKGGAVVILNKTDYIKEANRLLQNRDHYRRIGHDFTPAYTKQIMQSLQEMVKLKLIEKETELLLTPRQPRTPVFYILPKIHKINNPGRPIVSAISGPTDNMSRYVDTAIRPLVNLIPSYVKDTTHMLNILNDLHHIPSTAILLTMDVSALYTNIPHSEGISAVTKAMRASNILNPSPEVAKRMMSMILQKNCFEFNDKFYLQISGTAMGTAMAPSYANLFMSDLETGLLQNHPKKPYLWVRYIDDIFAIWLHSEKDLEDFIKYANSIHQTIKFTEEHSSVQIAFLDLNIMLKNNQIKTKYYHKKTDAFSYLHFSSCHPRHQKHAVPYSQFLRMNRNCTDKTDAKTSMDLLLNKFEQRGYPRKMLKSEMTRAMAWNQEQLLTAKTRNQDTAQPIIYVTKFNPNGPDINKILQDNKNTLLNHPHTEQLQNFMVAYRRPKNLRDILVHSKLTEKTNTSGTYRCRNCNICQYVKEGPFFYANQIRYRTTGCINCNTDYIIYMIECRQCQLKYIGQTSKNIRTRIYQHLRDIINHSNTSVAQHFTSQRHTLSDVSVRAITLAPRNVAQRLIVERTWISTLRTTTPLGLNVQNQ